MAESRFGCQRDYSGDLVDRVVGGWRGAGRGEGGGEGRQTTRELAREELPREELAREDTSCSTLSGSVSGRQQLSGSSTYKGIKRVAAGRRGLQVKVQVQGCHYL